MFVCTLINTLTSKLKSFQWHSFLQINKNLISEKNKQSLLKLYTVLIGINIIQIKTLKYIDRFINKYKWPKYFIPIIFLYGV